MTMIEDTRARTVLPRLGEPAPNLQAVGTRRRSGWRATEDAGPSLFAHPADFTPVCATEIVAFAEMCARCCGSAIPNSSGCRSAVSVRTPRGCATSRTSSRCRCRAVPPVRFIADLDRKVVAACGMVMPGERMTETNLVCVRHRPGGVLRAVIYYPLAPGATPARSCAWWTHCSPRIRTRSRARRTGGRVARSSCLRRRPRTRPADVSRKDSTASTTICAAGRSRVSASRGRRRGGVLLRPRLV